MLFGKNCNRLRTSLNAEALALAFHLHSVGNLVSVCCEYVNSAFHIAISLW